MSIFRDSEPPSTCPTCAHGVDGNQLSCLECGTFLDRSRRLPGAAWQLPVALAASLALFMATGIGFASGAVTQGGEVSVTEVPAQPGGTKGGDGQDQQLAQVPDGGPGGPGDGDGNGDGNNGDGDNGNGNNGDGDNGNGDGKPGDGKRGKNDDNNDGGGNGNGGGSGGGGNSGTAPAPREPETYPDFNKPVELERFPSSSSAYTVSLGSFSTRTAAERKAQEAAAVGIPAGIILSSDFPNLPGRYIAFAGRFKSKRAAEDENDFNYAGLGFKGDVTFVDGAGTGAPGAD